MQDIARLMRTVRYLNREQVLFRAINRGKRALYRVAGSPVERHLRKRAARLPDPDFGDGRMNQFSSFMLEVQSAKYADHLAPMRDGTFTLINRTVSFGSPGLVEWRRNLGEENNPLWRMNLSYFGYAVPLLAAGADDDLSLVVLMVESLEEQNPWNAPGVFRDVWFSYSVSHRIINLLAGISLWVGASGRTNDPRLDVLARHIKLCVEFLRRNLERELQFNHLFKNLLALKCFEHAVAGKRTTALVRNAFLLQVLEQQQLPDGGHVERSPMYHTLYIQDLRLLRLLDGWGADAKAALDTAEHQAVHALAHMTHAGNERVALMNDAWLGESLSPRVFLGTQERLPDRNAHVLSDTGYARVRYDDLSLIFDCGAAGPDSNLGHAHADFLALELMWRDLPLVVDPGTPIYTAGSLRDWCRSSATHNGPAIEGEEPLEFWKSFRVGRRGYAYPIGTGAALPQTRTSIAGYQTGYRHIGCIAGRYIEVLGAGELLILDVWHLRNIALSPRTAWLISDEWAVDEDAGSLSLHRGDLACRWSFSNALAPTIGQSPYYEEFGVARKATSVTVRPRTVGEWCWTAVQMSFHGGRPVADSRIDVALSWMQDKLHHAGGMTQSQQVLQAV
jgi:hypothetical protein